MTRLKSCTSTVFDDESGLKVKIPGNSPAYHIGDPRKDLLHIKSLDLIPNPIIMYLKVSPQVQAFLTDPTSRDQDIQLKLRGVLLEDIGPNPKLRLSVKQNGTPYASIDLPLNDDVHRLEVYQPGREPGAELVKGPIQIVGTAGIPALVVAPGSYTLRVQMWATEGARTADFEATAKLDWTDLE